MKNTLFHSGKHKPLPSFALLILRVALGGMMLTHGYTKLLNFVELSTRFPDPFGLGHGLSLGLVVFAEVVCAVLIIIGLGTRWASIPLIITMLVIVFNIHFHQPFSKMEVPLLYLTGFVVLLLMGAGKYSLDKMISKK
jgi:putative oxidoreductase